MNHSKDPETLKIPAFMRNKAIVTQARQKLILTALDRKEAGLSVHSKQALAPAKKSLSASPRAINISTKNRLPQNSPQPVTTNKTGPQELPLKLKEAGTVTHYLEKIQVAIIKLSTPLKNGEQLFIQGENCLFRQAVAEMQIDRKEVTKAKKGAHIGMKTTEKALVNGKIYKP